NLTFRFKKRRGALYTAIDLPDGCPMHTFNFHLGLAHFERVSQIKRILDAPAICDGHEEPVILGGDSNDWQGRLCRKLLKPRGFVEVGASIIGKRTPTFPAYRPVLPL